MGKQRRAPPESETADTLANGSGSRKRQQATRHPYHSLNDVTTAIYTVTALCGEVVRRNSCRRFEAYRPAGESLGVFTTEEKTARALYDKTLANDGGGQQ